MNLLPAFIHRRIAHRPNLVKIVDNIGWLFFDKILRMGVGLFVGVWVVRYLGPEQFGLLSFATAFTGLFGAIAALGLQSIVVRDIVRDPDTAKVTLGTAAMLQFIGGLVAYLLILGAITYMRPDDALARTIVAILGSMMLLKASDIAIYWFESQVQSKYVVWVQNGTFLSFALIKVALILNQASLIAFVWATLAETVIVAIILLAVMGKRGPSIQHLTISITRAKMLLADSWPLLFSAIAISIYMKIDEIMLAQVIGNAEVGIYAVAVRLSEVWYFTISIVLASVFPSLAQMHANQDQSISLRWIQAYRFMFLLSVAVGVFMMLGAQFVVEILFGSAYAAAAVVLSIHVWAGVNVAVGSVWSKWLLLENRLQIGLYGHIVGAAMNVALNFWLIPEHGAAGAAMATLVSYWSSALFVYSLYKPRVTFGYLGAALGLKRLRWN